MKRQTALAQIRKRKPYVHMLRTPISNVTNYNDKEFVEVSTPLYDVFLADGIFKMQMTVRWNANPTGLYAREFEVLQYHIVRIDGVDPKQEHVDQPDIALSIHPAIVQAMFEKYLSPYGIELQSVEMYNYKDFASTQFSFVDLDKKEALNDYIEETLKKKL